ncbi:hypothetical protein LNP74_34730 [Klebsiella pneumoniae subsp. pneumoniae]|nr:hypothetical protein [Klebsiella pneumoniae subsp. pneumoniae]
MICRWKIFAHGEATLKDNATTQKVNRTYQQVVTLNYAREYPAMEWQPDDPDQWSSAECLGGW